MTKKPTAMLVKATLGTENAIKYRHSSNSLFHFMKKKEYLTNIIQEKCIYPRYFIEDIGYMQIASPNYKIEQMGVLGICFCDIPLAGIWQKEYVEYDKDIPGFSPADKMKSHTDFYGEFAIAFSKEWAEKRNIQPIHYQVNDSELIESNRLAFLKAIELEDLPDEISRYFIDELAYKKPLYGYMARKEVIDGKTYHFKVRKNFHDEHEWRFIPSKTLCDEWEKNNGYALSPIEGRLSILEQEVPGSTQILNNLSHKVQEINDKTVCLNFEFSDIRYIVVPDSQTRTELIKFMTTLWRGKRKTSFRMSIYELISKITTLEDIMEDY